MKPKTKRLILLLLNLFVFVSTLIITILGLLTGPEANQPGSEAMYGIYYFKAFTVDSNVLSAIASLLLIIFLLKNKEGKLPKWLITFQFIAMVGVTITFLVTMFFLSPSFVIYTNNILATFFLYEGTLFLLHFLNPIIAAIIFYLIKREDKYTIKHAFLGMTTIILYSFFYIPFVLTGVWQDFYGFTFGGYIYLAPISTIVMYLIIFLVSLIYIKTYNKFIIK